MGKLFGPGSSTQDIVHYIREWFVARHGKDALAAAAARAADAPGGDVPRSAARGWPAPGACRGACFVGFEREKESRTVSQDRREEEGRTVAQGGRESGEEERAAPGEEGGPETRQASEEIREARRTIRGQAFRSAPRQALSAALTGEPA